MRALGFLVVGLFGCSVPATASPDDSPDQHLIKQFIYVDEHGVPAPARPHEIGVFIGGYLCRDAALALNEYDRRHAGKGPTAKYWCGAIK
jgi:hypothetical protein